MSSRRGCAAVFLASASFGAAVCVAAVSPDVNLADKPGPLCVCSRSLLLCVYERPRAWCPGDDDDDRQLSALYDR